ncbi:predicted protein [Culex quinquefasciatus]|uniref:Predicted protein n=1 Tax=Culex quinquefasciatus TaxID=7176 RepID=B0X7V3_CULQU|nr:predicted protein [Culex quinquefasciatus]|eukprot:XP_001865725.1 predicted protein [Culex quinquefasciatus]
MIKLLFKNNPEKPPEIGELGEDRVRIVQMCVGVSANPFAFWNHGDRLIAVAITKSGQSYMQSTIDRHVGVEEDDEESAGVLLVEEGEVAALEIELDHVLGSWSWSTVRASPSRSSPSRSTRSSSNTRTSTKMSDRKAVIKNADMGEEMQQDAVDCATQALEKYNIEKGVDEVELVQSRMVRLHVPALVIYFYESRIINAAKISVQ